MTPFIPLIVVLAILYLIIYMVMMTLMIIFERDKPKNIIIWSILFLLTSFIGFTIYLFFRRVYYKKRETLQIKKKEDEVYLGLIDNHLYNNEAKIDNELIEFNRLAYNSKLTTNNTCDVIKDYGKFKENLLKDLSKAKENIFIECIKINTKDFAGLKDILIAKAKENILVKIVYDGSLPFRFRRELMRGGVKVYRFSRYSTLGHIYSNRRNFVVIDGVTAYTGNFNVSKKQLNKKIDTIDAFLKISGDVVQEIDTATRVDIMHASGKFIPYNKPARISGGNCAIQHVENELDNDMELLIIKSIIMAKESIQLQLEGFIPTESILSLLKYAINSGIEVKLMVPLKANWKGKFYAYRAYSKELALSGATVYLYDGYINTNAIVVDSDFVLSGAFIIDREHLNTGLQNILVIVDQKIVNHFNKQFEDAIENSYRINNAKYMLLKEKFFKNFV